MEHAVHDFIDVMKDEHDSMDTTCTENSSLWSGGTTSTTKHVRFTSTPPQIIALLPLPTEMALEERNAIWWTSQDYQVFNETAKSISKEVRKHRKLTSGLEEACRRAEQASRSLQQEDRVEEALHTLALDPVSS